MRLRLLLALAVGALAVSTADAGWLRNRRSAPSSCATCTAPASVGYSPAGSGCPGGVCPVPASAGFATAATTATEFTALASSASSALDEVNAKRAARGLRPFVHDPALSEAAARCAAFRAQHRLFGHTASDFAFLPAGASASAAGCAAYPAEYGWLSCCTYDAYTYAGAAFVTGADGKRYMHLFCR